MFNKMSGIGRRLLVADDTPGLRDILVEIVQISFPDLNIQTADNGQDAYDKINAQRPDLLYTDVGMPIISGDVLIEKLLKDIELDRTKKPIPTIVISGADLGTERGKRAVDLALQMYTASQLERIKTYIPPPSPNGSPTHYEVFMSLHKPFNANDLIARTQLLLDTL